MSARLFPERCFLTNGFEIHLMIVRKFNGDFFRDELRLLFGKPDFAEAAVGEFSDERVKPDMLSLMKHCFL